ncbi:hypothetical protein HDU99_007981 [Rhizoclosmatium hyalinum]|nr:hypothetical protein HDU99_007981 [Rhizoclosmatium hyalinum]
MDSYIIFQIAHQLTENLKAMNSPKERAGDDFSSIQKWLKNLPSIGSLERLGGSLEDTSVGTSKRLKNSRETLNQSTKAALKDDMANLAAGKSDVSEPKPLTPKQSLGLESEKRDISGATTAAPLGNIYPQSASQGIPQITQSPSATLKKGGRLQEVASQQSPENTTMGSVISIQGLHTSSYSIAVSEDNTGYGSLTPAASSSPNLAARHLTNLGSKLIHSTNHAESASVFDKKHQLRTELAGFDRARNSSTSEFGSAESNPHTRLSLNSASTRGRKITAKDINNQVNSSREGINLIGSKNNDDPNRRPTASFDDGLARKSSLTGADFKRGILNTSNRRSSLAKEVQPIANTKADVMGSESSSLEQVQSAQGSENSLQQSDFDNNSSSQLEITSPKTNAVTSLLGAPQPTVVDRSSDSLEDPSNASRTKIKWDKTRIYTFEPGEDENGKARGSLSKAKKRDLMRV